IRCPAWFLCRVNMIITMRPSLKPNSCLNWSAEEAIRTTPDYGGMPNLKPFHQKCRPLVGTFSNILQPKLPIELRSFSLIHLVGLSILFSCSSPPTDTLFSPLPASQTGINFKNLVRESESFNVLT